MIAYILVAFFIPKQSRSLLKNKYRLCL